MHRGVTASPAALLRRGVLALALVQALAVARAAPARAEIADNSLGVNAHVPGPDLLDMADDLGVAWVRVDANWWQLAPAAGRYDWGFMDAVVDGARSRGLSVYMTLAYTPEWVPKVARTRSDTYTGNDEPAGSAEWVAFVEAAVARYRARGVTHFGIWNEPNLDGFWEEEAGADAWIDKILVPGADAVRRSCGDCRVLGPDLAHVGPFDDFLRRVLSRAKDSFDILAHHSYHGFPETGHSAFDGDSFVQALDMRRSAFTRASLREVLDDEGWLGEVWITETGYRAVPGDATEEDRQATYITRVLEEQLLRPWWTNTFFYELTDCGIDLPGCDIDGYGLTRPGRAGARTFPDDYRQKPAYDALRGFVAAHPEILAIAPPSECVNGVDDDGDGHVDARDRGCGPGYDDDESDDPPRLRVEALPAPSAGITVDGDLDEWGPLGFTTYGASAYRGGRAYGGVTDLTVRFASRWTTGTLCLGLEVTDDVQANDEADATLYLGDSAQVAFDVARNLGAAYDATDDHEVSLALVGGATRAHRFAGPAGASDAWDATVARRGTTTTYEVCFPAATLAPARLGEGDVLGFSFLVNDADGAGREGWIELTPGIGDGKDPYQFAELALVRMASPPPAGDAGPSPVDAGVDGGAGDGGGPPPPGGGGGGGCALTRASRSSAFPLIGLAFALLLGARRRRRACP